MPFGADRESSKKGSPAELVGNLVNLPTNSPGLKAEKKIQEKNNTRRIGFRNFRNFLCSTRGRLLINPLLTI